MNHLQLDLIEVEENVITSTEDYGKFSLDPANRPIDPERVHRLADAIKHTNLLHLFPIIVSPQFVVIDGQHRLRAAAHLRVPIYFIVSRAMRMADSSKVLLNTKGWTQTDWLHHWCARGNPEYLDLRDFWVAHQFVPISMASRLCQTQKFNVKEFADGLYQADSIPFASHVCAMAKDFKPWFKAWNSVTFVSALMQLAGNDVYSHKRMMMKMTYQSTKLVRCTDIDSYLALLTDIYNFNTRSEALTTFRAKGTINRRQPAVLVGR